MALEIALAHNHFDADHLEVVKAEMEVLGAPVIKAVWMECWAIWAALEGAHRIRAAAALGLIPVIEEVEYSEEITTADIGLGDAFGGDVWTIADVVDDAHGKRTFHFGEV